MSLPWQTEIHVLTTPLPDQMDIGQGKRVKSTRFIPRNGFLIACRALALRASRSSIPGHKAPSASRRGAMGSEKRKPPLGCHSSFLLIAMLLWPALALGAGASEMFEKVKNAVVVVKALGYKDWVFGQGSGVVLPSGEVATNNFAVLVEWLGEIAAQSKKAEPPPAAKPPETAHAPGLSSEPRRAESNMTWLSQAAELEAARNWWGLLEHSKRWTRAEPGKSLAWGALGLAYGRLGRWQEAIEACKEAVRLNPDLAEAWGGLVRAYFGSGNRVEALKAVKELRRFDPVRADQLFKQIMGQ